MKSFRKDLLVRDGDLLLPALIVTQDIVFLTELNKVRQSALKSKITSKYRISEFLG